MYSRYYEEKKILCKWFRNNLPVFVIDFRINSGLNNIVFPLLFLFIILNVIAEQQLYIILSVEKDSSKNRTSIDMVRKNFVEEYVGS